MIKYTENMCMDLEIGGCYQFIASLKNAAPLHYHDFYEIFLITSGCCVHYINGELKDLKKGMLVFMRPNDFHSYEKKYDNDCQFINLTFSKDTLNLLFNYLEKNFDYLLSSDMPLCITLSDSDFSILKLKLEELKTINWDDKSLLKMRLRLLLAEIFTDYFANAKGYKNYKEVPLWFNNLLKEMQKQENFCLGISQMTCISGKSREHISRCFKEYLKTKPTIFLNELKLNYAANLLISSDFDIMSISLLCNFQSLSHFYHIFKKQFKLSPADFRKQNRKIGAVS